MVRPFKPEDNDGVKSLILSILKQEYPFDKNAYADSDIFDISRTYTGEKNSFFVYESGRKIVGTVGIKGDSDKTALLRRLFVAPHFRRRGIGALLLAQGIDFCREKGYREVVFRATDKMKGAIDLIKKHGFTEQEKLEIAGFHIHLYRLKI
ncbi:MAG: GNAT family N-acetyltransferase [Candidatus Omnitrophica bacterium]|nr:GNAT family N-acetyltransferase [Candidatus Omnitrophota bacterium]